MFDNGVALIPCACYCQGFDAELFMNAFNDVVCESLIKRFIRELFKYFVFIAFK